MTRSTVSIRRLGESPPDSRFYIFAFAIRSAAELPQDFDIPAEYRSFECGVFLPRDDPDWFGRSSRPARVLLLSGGTLILAAHPQAEERVRVLALNELAFVEYGHILLQGWLRFVATDSVFELPFNTRSSRPVESFLSAVWDRYTPSGAIGNVSDASSFGVELDIKFRNAEHSGLEGKERIIARFFSPPQSRHRGFWLFGLESWRGGDYLGLSNRRLIWITDRNDQDLYQRYGSILRAAPVRTIRCISVESTGANCDLTCGLSAGRSWCMPVPLEHRNAARQFCDQVNISVLSGDHT